MPYAGLEQIGGKTVVFTQYQKTLTVAPSTTISGITVSLSSDGALSITGTAGEDGTIVVSDNGVSIPANHRLLFTRTGTGDYAWGRQGFTPFNNGDTELDYALNNHNAAWTANIRIYIYSGVTYNITGAKFNICDMTLLFGSDYNPSQDQAYSDYRALFPASYYAYNAGTLLSAGVTEVVSKSKNLADYSLGEGLPSDTTVSNVPRKFPLGKYVVGITYNNQWRPARITSHEVQNSTITQTINDRSDGVGIGIPFECESSTKYTMSATLPANGAIIINWYKEDGTFINSGAGSTTSPKTDTSPSTAKYGVMILYATAAGTYTYSNVQIEEGENASPYRPAVLQNYSIPASIQALEGYGWSAGSAYNYVDFERKVFVKNVEKIVLNGDDSQTFNAVNFQGVNGAWTYVYNVTNNKFATPSWQAKGNVISDIVPTTSAYGIAVGNIGVAVDATANNGICINIGDSSLNTAALIKAYLSANPITVYYELATPVEIDISEYLTDDNLISVESGGTLTFPNSNGTDYQIPVPSEETYMIDLQEAISNG